MRDNCGNKEHPFYFTGTVHFNQHTERMIGLKVFTGAFEVNVLSGNCDFIVAKSFLQICNQFLDFFGGNGCGLCDLLAILKALLVGTGGANMTAPHYGLRFGKLIQRIHNGSRMMFLADVLWHEPTISQKPL